MEQQLREISIRVTGVFDKDNRINVLGYFKKKDGTKISHAITIFKYKKDGSESRAFMDFKRWNDINSIGRGDLLVLLVSNYNEYNGVQQYVAVAIKDMFVSKFKGQLYVAPEANATTKPVEVKQEQVAPSDDLPWQMDL